MAAFYDAGTLSFCALRLAHSVVFSHISYISILRVSDFMVLPLSNITPGKSVRIEFLGNSELMAGRLRDLGFETGAVISCVMQRPKKNIAAYLVRNAVIALRWEDSRLIFVAELPPDIKSPDNSPEEIAADISPAEHVSYEVPL